MILLRYNLIISLNYIQQNNIIVYMNHLYIASITAVIFCIFSVLDKLYIVKTRPTPSIIIKNCVLVFGSTYLAIYCLQLLVQYKVLPGGKLPTPAFIGSPEF